ncbi:NAD(P)/FAD-dependent oxidoreductase [Roseobacter sinensis]|uniref:FAD-binding oxidoreductase n=1 Tax=Roseobacter sinensis TaxID=2931391 RepID=A0ABT3BLE1_9RHOB|nr:FAD-binding oxidoreductase [Roseobacter sp. WL0113]MCV3274376.1 FAD-binding oxidoreductase [Roseobacter sp. WL0113]
MTGQSVYWDENVPSIGIATSSELPKKTDIAIIGGGYTGLATAIHLARAGRQVAVFEAGEIGTGCSARNGGMVGPSFHKLGTQGLIARYGETKTLALLREGLNALDYFESIVQEEQLDCDLQLAGRFRGSRTQADYEAQAREGSWLKQNLGLAFDMVPKSEQHTEIGSDFYVGGGVYHRDGGVHPRKLLAALARCAEQAGVMILSNTAVELMQKDSGRTILQTVSGQIIATEVVVATNAYADNRTSAMHKRIIRIDTGAVATEPLSRALIDELSPKGRTFGESGRIFMWFRPTPDRRRFIFGGRMGRSDGGTDQRAHAIRGSMLRVFPQLKDVGFSHVWSGNVAYTRDHAPHIGQEDGVWLAGGYCGSGVTRSLYFGMKLARKILKQRDSETAFDDLPFAPLPFRPFAEFGAKVLTKWYAWQDARDLRTHR